MRTSIRSALFVDFDNIFTALKNDYGEDTARRFATNPVRWIDWLSRLDAPEPFEGESGFRRILLRRCYLNPHGRYKDDNGKWVGSGRYRVDFTRAACEVVDCPSLTRQGKSSADVNMALDVVDALNHQGPAFDEFIILSGDADFTPVLLRLRRHDRRVMIVTPNLASQAYRAVADVVIDTNRFVERALTQRAASIGDSDAGRAEPTRTAEPGAAPEGAGKDPPVSPGRLVEVDAFLRQRLPDASEAAPLGQLAAMVRSRFGNDHWFGHKTFKAFLAARLPHLGSNLVIHDRRDVVYSPPPPHLIDEVEEPRLHDLATRIHAICGVPLLRSAAYTKVFDVICEVIRRDGFQIRLIGETVHGRLREVGYSVSRNDVTWILHNLLSAGCDLRNDRSPIAATMADKFEASVLGLVVRNGLELTAEELSIVDRWIEPSHRPKESAPTAGA